jgi:FKBP-type peptidyl-prolyl cis-trans isomerase FklB
MNKYLLINALLALSLVNPMLVNAEDSPAVAPVAEQSSPDVISPDMIKERGYFFGYSFGNMLREGGNQDVDQNSLMKGLLDALAGTTPDLTAEQREAIIALIREKQEVIIAEKEAAEKVAQEEGMESAALFMTENGEKDNIVTTRSGLQYEQLQEGNGASPLPSDRVVVHYEGRLTSGKIFDSSIARQEPAEFGLQQVIAGWTEGLQVMSVGGKYRFFIPPELAYGPGGVPGIPPNSVLIFDVELLEIK